MTDQPTLYVARFDHARLLPLPHEVDLSAFGRPSDYRIHPYLLPSMFGKAEIEEAAARTVLGLADSDIDEWFTIPVAAVAASVKAELQSYAEGSDGLTHSGYSSTWLMAGQPTQIQKDLFDRLLHGFRRLVDTRYLGYDESTGVFWPLPTLLEKLTAYRQS